MTAAKTTTLAAALVKAQQAMPKVEPDAVNPHFRSKFVSLDHLIAKTRPVLNAHGLAIVQFPTLVGDERVLRTVIVHESGETMDAGDTPLVGVPDMQKLGAAITYARRYSWAATLGIVSDEDDDANSVTQSAGGRQSSGPSPAAAAGSTAGADSESAPASPAEPHAPQFQSPAGEPRTDGQVRLIRSNADFLVSKDAFSDEALIDAARNLGATGDTVDAVLGSLTKAAANELIQKLRNLKVNIGRAAA